MDKMVIIFIFLVFSLTLSYPTFAVPFSSSVSPNVTNVSVANQFFNFSVFNNYTNTSRNITQVNITFPPGFGYIQTSNNTTAGNTNFTNFTTAGSVVVIWGNTTPQGFISNGTTQYFSVNVSVPNNFTGVASFNISTLDNATTFNSTFVNVSVRGVLVNNFPASREFGNSTVTINCSAYSNNILGNITIHISNLTSFNQTLNDWNTPVWNNIAM